VTRQDPETALFAGLIHEVGALYLISRANDYPVLLANELGPVLSPFDSMPEWRDKSLAASVDMVIGKETLVEILAESAEELASLTKALQF
jgi:hypothetical protein